MDTNISKGSLVLFLFLTGCFSELNVSSTYSFEKTGNEANILKEIVPQIIKEAESSGGKCDTGTFEKEAVCEFDWDNGSYASVWARRSSKTGEVTFTIRSSSASIFPKGRSGVIDGKYLSPFHSLWEKWATDAFSMYKMRKKTRYYSGFDVEQDI